MNTPNFVTSTRVRRLFNDFYDNSVVPTEILLDIDNISTVIHYNVFNSEANKKKERLIICDSSFSEIHIKEVFYV